MKKVLILEDEVNIRSFVVINLKRAGYDAIEAGTGQEALDRLMERESPAVFFSQDLCARYFTYCRNGEAHFVLFDDAGTLTQKVKVGSSLGFSAAFFMWPEVRDIAGDLFR